MRKMSAVPNVAQHSIGFCERSWFIFSFLSFVRFHPNLAVLSAFLHDVKCMPYCLKNV